MENIIQQIQKDLTKSIGIGHYITSKVGDIINVGEEFKVKFTITNNSPYRVKISHLQVYSTPFASIIGISYDATDRIIFGRLYRIPVLRSSLFPNMATSIEFTMKAKLDLETENSLERFARVKIHAKFFPEDIFSITKWEYEYTDIFPEIVT